MRTHWLSFVLFIWAEFHAVPRAEHALTLAQRPGSPLDDYVVDVWTTEQGLPQNSITDIAQTPDGYLWLSTFNGLARFDGVRFVNFDVANTPAFKTSRFVRLEVAPDGALWIFSESYDVV